MVSPGPKFYKILHILTTKFKLSVVNLSVGLVLGFFLMMKTIVSLAVLVASVSAFSSLACAGLRLKRGSAARNIALLRHAPMPSITKLKAQNAQASSPDEVCAVESGDTEGCTASNSFKRKDGKDMTKLEKEQLYLDCCASWNVKATALLEDGEFEDLKEDLTFDGSQVMLMSREEIQFMVAKNR